MLVEKESGLNLPATTLEGYTLYLGIRLVDSELGLAMSLNYVSKLANFLFGVSWVDPYLISRIELAQRWQFFPVDSDPLVGDKRGLSSGAFGKGG